MRQMMMHDPEKCERFSDKILRKKEIHELHTDDAARSQEPPP